MARSNQGERAEIMVEHTTMSLVVAAIVAFFWAWPIMLLLGALHIEWPAVPAFGYWTSYLVTVGLLFVTRR